jgi:hypothetical protein
MNPVVITTLLALVSVCGLTGCAHIEDYPEEYGKPVIPDTNLCASIDGTYDIIGADLGKDEIKGLDWHLTSYLLSPEIAHRIARYAPSAIQIGSRIINDRDYLVIKVFSLEKVIYENTLGRDSFECTNEGIKFESVKDQGAVFIGGWRGYVDAMFIKSEEGDLVMKHREVGFGVFTVIPFTYLAEKYARWPAIHDTKTYVNPDASDWFIKELKIGADYLCARSEEGLGKDIGDIFNTDYFVDKKRIEGDLLRAHVWYRRSFDWAREHESERLEQISRDRLSQVESEITPEQLEKAVQMYSQWQPGHCQAELMEILSALSE